MKLTNQLLLIIFCLLASPVIAQDVDFEVSSPVCINENIALTNLSPSVNQYLWDFCVTDLSKNPVISEMQETDQFGSIFSVNGKEESGEYHLFLVSLTENAINRVDFGANLSEKGLVESIGNPGNLLNSPSAIELVQFQGNWYGFVTNFGNNSIIRLDFGGSLYNVPSAVSLGSTLSQLDQPSSIKYAQYNNEHYLIVTNGNFTGGLVRIKLGNSVTNNPVQETLIPISSADRIRGLELVQDCDTWYALISSFGNNKLIVASLTSDLSLNQLDHEYDLTSPVNLSAISEAGNHYFFVQLRGGSIRRIDYGDNFSTKGIVHDLGTISTEGNGLFIASFRGEFFGFSAAYNDSKLSRLSFDNNCNSSFITNDSFTPTDMKFNQSGEYQISLTRYENNCPLGTITRRISVVDLPQASIQVSPNVCIETASVFTAGGTDGTVDSYQWDFGDQTTGSGQEVLHQYELSGNYTVELRVESEVGCINTTSQEIRMYEPPPSSSFTVPPGDLCSYSDLMFTNTMDVAGLEDVIEYHWDYDGEGSTSGRDGHYQFTTLGTKQIDLYASIPGCTTSVTSQTVEVLNEGLDVAIDYGHNCRGDSVIFEQTVLAGSATTITSQMWEFGDGNISENSSPIHSYTSEGEYEVVYHLQTADGCNIESRKTIIITYQEPVGVELSDSVQNVPITFTGIDRTPLDDQVISWSWVIDGLSGEGRTQTRRFTTKGEYSYTLSVQTAQGCEYTYTRDFIIGEPTMPYVSFSVPDTVCIGEQLRIDNLSENASKYYWGFCDQLTGESTIESLDERSTLGAVFSMKGTESSGEYHLFIVSFTGNQINRIDYKDQLDDQTAIVSLGNIGGVLNSPSAIELVQQGSNWYGFVTNFGNNSLIRLEFGTSLTNTPQAQSLGNIGGLLEQPVSVDYIEESGQHYLMVANGGNTGGVVLIEFGSQLQGSPQGQRLLSIGGVSRIRGFSVIKDEEQYYGLVSSFGTNEVVKVSLSGLKEEFKAQTKQSILAPVNVDLIEEFGRYYGLVLQRNGGLYKYSYGESLSNEATRTSLGQIGQDGNGLTFGEYRGTVFGIASRNNYSQISQVRFTGDCASSLSNSQDEEPKGVNYQQAGNYIIKLIAYDDQFVKKELLMQVFVKNTLAKPLSFTTTNIECATSEATFQVESIDGDFTGYTWDFGDGGVAEGDNPTHKFNDSGFYDVTVTGSSPNGCTNSERREINIFASPLDPDFDVIASQFCTEQDLLFVNKTNESGYDPDVINYKWTVNSEEYTDKSPSIVFDNSGQYNVSLIVDIPGCVSDPVDTSFFVAKTDIAEFNYSSGCESTPVMFDNLVTNPDLSFTWDFGDGYSSSSYEPEHFYDASGTYDVTLTVQNDEGCINTQERVVLVDALPATDFTYGFTCSGDTVFLTDITEVNRADVTGWEWYMDGADVPFSTAKNPKFTPSQAGTYDIKLHTTASNGCENETTKQVVVAQSPAPIIQLSEACYGEVVNISDVSINKDLIQSRKWIIDGEVLDVSLADFQYLFATPGEHEVTLTLTNSNLCINSVSAIIDVPTPPSVQFVIDGNCNNSPTYLYDETVEGSHEIVSRRWFLNDQFLLNGPTGVVENYDVGEYEVKLEVITTEGCMHQSSSMINIYSSPSVEIIASNDFGVPPFELTFSSNSQNATSITWYRSGKSVSNSSNTSITFLEEGVFDVCLVAVNDDGCIDSLCTTIESTLPEVDLIIESIELVEGNNGGQVFLDVLNASNLPIENFEVEILLEDDYSLIETVESRINTGEITPIKLDFNVPANSSLDYMCVRINSFYDAVDQNELDNEACVSLKEKEVFEPAFPNPATEFITQRSIIPQASDIHITLLDMSGQVQYEEHLGLQPAGLLTFTLDLFKFNAGTYFLIIEHENGLFRSRFVKQ